MDDDFSEDLVKTAQKTAELVNERLKIDFQQYRQTVAFLGANVPLGVLCLPGALENLLRKQGIDRVYDCIGRDFSKIKGLGERRIDLLTSRLDEFFAVSF